MRPWLVNLLVEKNAFKNVIKTFSFSVLVDSDYKSGWWWILSHKEGSVLKLRSH